ncbi:MAG: biopolymer transporter ExbD [Rhodobacteraceae bacterium]|nr:biopolymer transporter ExbD [Paracoccaceae bacterium]
MFHFAPPQRFRRPDLTPMIDVVFLLLIFFMLVSSFDRDTALSIQAAGRTPETPDWPGPPRVIDIGEDGAVTLNGGKVAPGHLAHMLLDLMESSADPIILRPRGADLQDLLTLIEDLGAAGFGRLIVMN